MIQPTSRGSIAEFLSAVSSRQGGHRSVRDRNSADRFSDSLGAVAGDGRAAERLAPAKQAQTAGRVSENPMARTVSSSPDGVTLPNVTQPAQSVQPFAGPPGDNVVRDVPPPDPTGCELSFLAGDISEEQLRSVTEPAALLNSRLEAVRESTTAQIRSTNNAIGQPLNSSWLSSAEQAQAMLARLEAMGLNLGGIEEVTFGSGPFAIDYQGETRRCYTIGGMNVGMLVERYAKYPVEVADRITLDECEA